jgi:hypothetical protein
VKFKKYPCAQIPFLRIASKADEAARRMSSLIKKRGNMNIHVASL